MEKHVRNEQINYLGSTRHPNGNETGSSGLASGEMLLIFGPGYR